MDKRDRFDVYKEACKAMDEMKWKQAEVGFRLLADYCWEMSVKEEIKLRKAKYGSKKSYPICLEYKDKSK